MCRFRKMRRWLCSSHGMVHWVSGGMFLKRCILLSTIFIVSKGRSVGLRPWVPLKQPGFKRAQVAFLGVIPTRKNDVRIRKQAGHVYFHL